MAGRTGLAVAVAAASLISLIGARPTIAATYTDNISANPASFTCGYFVSTEICGSYAPFSDGPRTLNAGDQVTENVTYSSAVAIPGSNTSNLLYVGLPDVLAVGGLALPGANSAQIGNINLLGYSGPPVLTGALSTYTTSFLNLYLGFGGLCCAYGAPNAGYAVTGIGMTFDILTSDPNLIYGTSFGYAVDLPATPAVLSSFPGGSVGSPEILPAGLTGMISSNISGGVSDSQFYDFIWGGGLFQTQGAIVGANAQADFHFQLYPVTGSPVVEGVTPTLADILLNYANGYKGTITDVNLPAGNYEIGMFTNSPFDPQFSITFNTPVGIAAVPEPTTWAMLLLGVCMIGGAIRARHGKNDLAPTIA